MPLEPLFWERDFQRACLGARSLRPARPAKERNFTAALLAGQPASLRAHSPLYRRSAPTTLSAAVSHAYPTRSSGVRAGTGSAWTGAASLARGRPHMPSTNHHRLPRAWAAWSINFFFPANAVLRLRSSVLERRAVEPLEQIHLNAWEGRWICCNVHKNLQCAWF